MVLSQEFITLVLYAAQQMGMVLAVGGQTVMLLAYLIAMRDRVVDSKETQYYRAVRAVLFSGLALVALSGIGISAMHYAAGELAVLMAPSYLFKWLLVFAVFIFAVGLGKFLPQWLHEGFAGGTLYALFFIHILAPVTTWETLLMLYGSWLLAFLLCWTALVFGTREKSSKTPASSPASVSTPVSTPAPATKQQVVPNIPSAKVQPPVNQPLLNVTPPPVPKFVPPSPAPVVPPVVITPKMPEAVLAPVAAKPPAPKEVILSAPKVLPPPAPLQTPAPASTSTLPPLQKPTALASIPDPDVHPNLPALRVMPKTPEEIGNEHRPALVKMEPDVPVGATPLPR